MNNATYCFNHAHQRIAKAWGQVLDKCRIKRLERNRMHIQPSQMMIAAANIEIQIAIDIWEMTELSDAELQIKLHRRLRNNLQEMLKQIKVIK